MRNLSRAAAVSFMLCAISTISHAQMPAQQAPVAASHKLNLTLEQRHVIKENIKDIGSENAQPNVQPALGEPVPASVKLQPIPAQVAEKVPQVKAHAFFVADGEIVIVDPKDNRVAEIIKLAGD